ncbi:MAG TPA: lipid II flippase MurJ [Candidatus Paceibacterota bacterium]|nr:lipid II flippase MurJ [Candidatus Paceibacterota bacterium]
MFHAMYKEVRNLHQAAYILALFTFGSQLLALVRDRLLAHQFGAGVELDLYYAAFRIPDLLYVVFASALSVYVLVPFVTNKLEKNGDASAREFLSQIFTLFVYVYIALALLIFFCAPVIVETFFSGFSGEHDTFILLMRILLVQPFLLGISSLFGVVTQMRYRFIVYAIGPLLYNVGIIVGLVALYPIVGVAGIAWGVVLGASAHLIIQIPFVAKTSLMPRLVRLRDTSNIFEVLRTSFFRALTLSLHQIVLLGLVAFASSMVSGSVAVFQFAYNLQSVPLAIIGVSYSVAAFPHLAKLFAEKRMDVFGNYITSTLRHIIFWSLPVIVLFVVVRAQFVRSVLGTGAFDWNDTRLTAAILALFILSLASQAIHLLIVRALYAVGNTRLPFFVTIFSSSITMSVAYGMYLVLLVSDSCRLFFERLMRLEGVAGIEVLALPIGYSVGLFAHSICILILARKQIHISLTVFVKPLIQTAGASLFAGYLAYSALNYFVHVFKTDTFFSVFFQGLLAGVVGIIGFAAVQYLFKNREFFEVLRMFKKRLVKSGEVIAPQDEDMLSV